MLKRIVPTLCFMMIKKHAFINMNILYCIMINKEFERMSNNLLGTHNKQTDNGMCINNIHIVIR